MWQPLAWLKGQAQAGDAAVAGYFADRSKAHGASQLEALRNQISGRVGDYRHAAVDRMAPDVAGALGREPNDATAEQLGVIRRALGYDEGVNLVGVKPDEEDFVARLSAVRGDPKAPPSGAYQDMALALAQLRAAQNPSIAARVQQGLGSLSGTLASNAWARGGLYAGAGAGAVAGTVAAVPPMTAAGQELLALMGFLQQGEETEAQRQNVLTS